MTDTRKEFGIGDVLMTAASGGLWPVAKYGRIALDDMRAERAAMTRQKKRQGIMDAMLGIQNEIAGVQGQDFFTQAAANPALQQQFAARMGTVEGYNPSLLGQLMMQQNDLGAVKAQREGLGGYQNLKAKIDTQSKLSKDAASEFAPMRASLSSYENLRNIFTKAKGDFENISGADDQAIIKLVQKMILPNEAVMSDDQLTAVKNSGAWSQLEAYKEWLTNNKGAGLGKAARRNLFELANTLRQEQMERLRFARGRHDVLARSAQFEPGDIYQTRQWGNAISIPPPGARLINPNQVNFDGKEGKIDR